MIAIFLVVIISSAVYFALTGALDSWGYCRDQLSLQKVLTETMDKMISGTVSSYGLKDSLEIVAAGSRRMEFISPWVDAAHIAASRDFVYTLNRRLKPGAPVPIAEMRMAENVRWKLVPVQMVLSEDPDRTQLKLALSVPEGSELRFVFHPDWKKYPDSVKKIFWDKKTGEIMMESGDEVESLSKNFFGVEIIHARFTYYTSNNELISTQEWVDETDLQVITGVQLELEAKLGEQTQRLVRFVNLRNSPMRTGYLTMKQGMRVLIPDSKHIKTLMITNLSGISNNDTIQLEMLPRSGNAMRVTVEFERLGSAKPTIKKIDVEYPQQRSVYTEYPKITTDLGINLMLLGSDGQFDYDDDEDVDDAVNIEGDVILYVNEMTIEGAGLFVRP